MCWLGGGSRKKTESYRVWRPQSYHEEGGILYDSNKSHLLKFNSDQVPYICKHIQIFTFTHKHIYINIVNSLIVLADSNKGGNNLCWFCLIKVKVANYIHVDYICFAFNFSYTMNQKKGITTFGDRNMCIWG